MILRTSESAKICRYLRITRRTRSLSSAKPLQPPRWKKVRSLLSIVPRVASILACAWCRTLGSDVTGSGETGKVTGWTRLPLTPILCPRARRFLSPCPSRRRRTQRWSQLPPRRRSLPRNRWRGSSRSSRKPTGAISPAERPPGPHPTLPPLPSATPRDVIYWMTFPEICPIGDRAAECHPMDDIRFGTLRGGGRDFWSLVD